MKGKINYTIWVNFITTSARDRTLEIMVSEGNHPTTRSYFRLVEYVCLNGLGFRLVKYVGLNGLDSVCLNTGNRQNRSFFKEMSIFSCVEAFPGSRAFLENASKLW